MDTLHIFTESFTNGFNYNAIIFISILSVLCGIFVIISKNPIVSVLFLIGLFLSVAAYLMLLGMNFIGLSYLLVYVGAVSILFLFILMLINVRISELTTDNSNSVPLGIAIAIFYNITLYKLLDYNVSFTPSLDSDIVVINSYITHKVSNSFTTFYNKDLSYVTANVWDGVLAESSHITTIGNILYTNYPLWLIITSLILLLAMVGAIIITIKQKN